MQRIESVPIDVIDYLQLRKIVVATMGPDFVEFCFQGQPRGFTPSRYVGGASKSELKSKSWAKALRMSFLIAHQIPYLVATKDNNLFFYTESYFKNGVHCDPENVHKLVKDSLFYKTPKGMGSADKHTGGCYAGPLYDRDKPRTEILIWGI